MAKMVVAIRVFKKNVQISCCSDELQVLTSELLTPALGFIALEKLKQLPTISEII